MRRFFGTVSASRNGSRSRTRVPQLERERARRVRDEDPPGEFGAQLSLESRFEADEDVVEPGTAAVGAHHRAATRIAPAEAPVGEAALREVVTKLEARTV